MQFDVPEMKLSYSNVLILPLINMAFLLSMRSVCYKPSSNGPAYQDSELICFYSCTNLEGLGYLRLPIIFIRLLSI